VERKSSAGMGGHAQFGVMKKDNDEDSYTTNGVERSMASSLSLGINTQGKIILLGVLC